MFNAQVKLCHVRAANNPLQSIPQKAASKRTKFWTSARLVTNVLNMLKLRIPASLFWAIRKQTSTESTPGKATRLGGSSSSSTIPKWQMTGLSVAQLVLWTWCRTILVSSDSCRKVLPSCMTAVEPSVMVRINTRDTRPQCKEVCGTGPRGLANVLHAAFSLNTRRSLARCADLSLEQWNFRRFYEAEICRIWSKALPEEMC